MNVQGVALERRAGRPLMSRLHAGHALGVLAGGAAGTRLKRGDAGGAPAGAAHRGGVVARARVLAGLDRRLALLGAVAFCASLLDGGAYAWIGALAGPVGLSAALGLLLVAALAAAALARPALARGCT